MKKMSFQENLWRKIEIERLSSQVIASIGTGQARYPVDKEAMRSLLDLSPYQYQRERDLDLYVKPVEGELKMVLVLDNELPLFRSTVNDVVTRRNPKTLEMWSFRTIRNILVDSDIKVSAREESVERVMRDAVAQLDLNYTDRDIEDLAREGMVWLAGNDANGVKKILAMFSALLGYKKPPKYFGLDTIVCYGLSATGPDKHTVFGPLALYRTHDNTLLWIDQSFTRPDSESMESLRSLAMGQASVPITGNAVFQKLQAYVLEQPRRFLTV